MTDLQPLRILALDPGERVGWARAVVAPDGSWSELRHGITPLKDMALAVSKADYDVIVCEDWRLRPATARNFIGSSFPSVQFIGMVRLCCWLSNTKLVMQGADTKSTADKTMAQLWPAMYEKVSASRAHDDAHDMDAIRHLWFYTYRNTDGIPQPQEAA